MQSNMYRGQESLEGRNVVRHWKYIYKKKVNGKMKYYYLDDIKKDDNFKEIYEKTSGNPNSKYGTYVSNRQPGNWTVNGMRHLTGTDTIIRKKGSSLLTSSKLQSDGRNRVRTIEVGKLEQAYDSFIKSSSSLIAKGKKFVDRLF